MSRLWVKEIKRHRIERQEAAPCAWGAEQTVLREMMQQMDLPSPIWLKKHEREYDEFRRTSFLPDHFVEDVSFERIEIEYLDDTDKKRKSSDPRNAF